MKTIGYKDKSIDKSTWGDGPWQEEPDKVWWFGFDCAHCCDECPAFNRFRNYETEDIYRDIAYVKSEVADLALQLKKLEGLAEWHTVLGSYLFDIICFVQPFIELVDYKLYLWKMRNFIRKREREEEFQASTARDKN